MIFMASNFDVVFDPSVNFKPDEEGEVNGYNTTGIADEGLYEAAVAMRQTTPGDVLEYCQKWLTFQERFQEVVPMIPVYSSEYYDFYPRELQNYAVADNITWSKAIVGAYLGDVAEVEEAAEG